MMMRAFALLAVFMVVAASAVVGEPDKSNKYSLSHLVTHGISWSVSHPCQWSSIPEDKRFCDGENAFVLRYHAFRGGVLLCEQMIEVFGVPFTRKVVGDRIYYIHSEGASCLGFDCLVTNGKYTLLLQFSRKDADSMRAALSVRIADSPLRPK